MSLRSMRRGLTPKNKHLLAGVAIHGYKVFHVYKPTPAGKGRGPVTHVKNTLNPIEIKSSALISHKRNYSR